MLLNHAHGGEAIYRICALFLTVNLTFPVNGFAQDSLVNLPYGWIKAGNVINSVEKRIPVSWSKDVLDTSRYIHTYGPVPVRTALRLLTDPFNLTYVMPDSTYASIQHRSIANHPIRSATAGTFFTIFVFDKTGQPLPSASVQDIFSKKTWHTDSLGIITIQSPLPALTLIVSYVNFIPDTVTLAGSGTQEIHLQCSNTELDEDVVVGYERAKRRFLTSDHTKLKRGELNSSSSTSLPASLGGLVPGLFVTPTSGFPGSSSSIILRGKSSIYNNYPPLIIIDGVILIEHSMASLPANNAGGSLDPSSFISSEDIESIEVLKDADATAIYGSRGANGVILITTRQSESKNVQIHLRLSSGMGEVSRRAPLMNTRQYLGMRRDAFHNDQPADSITPANAADLTLWDTTRYTNWGQYFLGSLAHTNSLGLSVAGGNSNNSFFVGLNGLHETTVFPLHPVHRRVNSCLNFSHNSADGKMTIQLSALTGLDENNQFIYADPTSYTLLAPDAPALKNSDGSLYFGSSPLWSNPLSLMEQPYRARSHHYLVSATVRYNIEPWITFKTDLGFDVLGSHETGYSPISAQDPSTQPTGTAYFAQTAYNSWIVEPQLEIKKQFGKFSFNNLDGFSWQALSAHNNFQVDTGSTNDAALHVPNPAIALVDTTVNPTNYDYRAWFSRVSINYDNTYLLNATGRLDGSNRFGPGIHYAAFYAVGTAFVFSELGLLRNTLPFLSLGKLRASTGITGNDQIGDRWESENAPTNVPFFNNIPGFFTSSEVAVGSRWETILKREIALDLGFEHDRYLLTCAWYSNQSKDQLLPQSYPIPGIPEVYENWPAVLRNTGWEFSVSARLIEKRDFSWKIDLNWTIPVNRLVSFSSLPETPYAHLFVVGQSIDVVQGWHYTGVDRQTGIFTFEDRNHDQEIDDSDKMVIGHLDPKGFGGILSNVRYKKFEFQILFDARLITGNNYITSLYSSNPPGTLFSGFYSNAPSQLAARWKATNDHAAYQEVFTDISGKPGDAIAHFTGSDASLTNASFLRLKKLMLSYTLPPVLPAGRHGCSINLFISGQNLFIWSPYKHVDPEIQSATILPPLRTIEGGIRLAL